MHDYAEQMKFNLAQMFLDLGTDKHAAKIKKFKIITTTDDLYTTNLIRHII